MSKLRLTKRMRAMKKTRKVREKALLQRHIPTTSLSFQKASPMMIGGIGNLTAKGKLPFR